MADWDARPMFALDADVTVFARATTETPTDD